MDEWEDDDTSSKSSPPRGQGETTEVNQKLFFFLACV